MSSQLDYLKEDLNRYFVLMGRPSFSKKILIILESQGIWCLVSYRMGRYVRKDFKVPFLRSIFKIVTHVAHFVLTVVTKIEISFDVDIKGGFYIGHFGYIVVNPTVKIGSNCNISQGCVIGEGGRGSLRGTPVIGSQVYIAPGAKIFGPITVGDNVAVGANAVVNDSIPDNAVVVGIPGKIVSYKGASDFIVVDES
jgi:serine O-acetyltransferase